MFTLYLCQNVCTFVFLSIKNNHSMQQFVQNKGVQISSNQMKAIISCCLSPCSDIFVYISYVFAGTSHKFKFFHTRNCKIIKLTIFILFFSQNAIIIKNIQPFHKCDPHLFIFFDIGINNLWCGLKSHLMFFPFLIRQRPVDLWKGGHSFL